MGRGQFLGVVPPSQILNRHLIRIMGQYSRLARRGKRLVLVWTFICCVWTMSAWAQESRNVFYFDIQGLRLNMNLDEVIKALEINTIKTSKDSFGIVNGYEIKKSIDDKKIVLILNFTGEKRLYRIQYSILLEDYRYRSQELLQSLIDKYGKPALENRNSEGAVESSSGLYACWGTSCNQYPQTTPTMTANIFQSTGILRLRLFDNRIFNTDWRKYRIKQDSHLESREKPKGRSEKKLPIF